MNETFEVAERQHGLLTRAQLTKLGFSDAQIQRRVSAGVLARVLPNVFRVVGSVPTVAQRRLAACLWVGPSAVLSHATAGSLMKLEGITTDEIHVTVPANERRRGHGIVVHGSVVSRHDLRIVDSVPCTSAARTLLDCAISLDDETLEAAFESARRMGLVTPATLQRSVARRPGAAALRRVLAAAEHRPAESRLEVKLARLLRESRLPVSTPQHRIGPYRVDRAWPEHRVAVEADGFEHHGKRLAWKRDRTRVAAIEAMGWRLVHVTWADVVERPAETLDRIRHALGTIAA
jgi:very-short-patch-repair endonuclease